VAAGAPGKVAANWILNELIRLLNDRKKPFNDSPPPAALAELLNMIESKQITAGIGKRVFITMFETGRPAADIVAAEGLGAQVGDDAIEKAAREVIEKNPDNVAKFKSGNEGVFKFFVGQVMKATKGQADPQAVNDIVRRLLS
jgi:aspartyl-tRNA(Asn)/glutamyl-tRNA(Gln) amidotransferase subunit B